MSGHEEPLTSSTLAHVHLVTKAIGSIGVPALHVFTSRAARPASAATHLPVPMLVSISRVCTAS